MSSSDVATNPFSRNSVAAASTISFHRLGRATCQSLSPRVSSQYRTDERLVGYRFAAADDHSATSWSRRRNFWTFVADIGHSVTTRTYRGTLKLAIAPWQKAMISPSVTVAPGFNWRNAAGTST